MKTNGILLIIEAMLALMTACFVQMPETIFSWDLLFGWTLAFCFYFCMFAPAWQFRSNQDSGVK
jgi:hypothetical protein